MKRANTVNRPRPARTPVPPVLLRKPEGCRASAVRSDTGIVLRGRVSGQWFWLAKMALERQYQLNFGLNVHGFDVAWLRDDRNLSRVHGNRAAVEEAVD